MINDNSQTIFIYDSTLSISMFLQSISPIGRFITMLGLTERFFESFYSNNSMKNDLSQTIFNCLCRLSISMFLQNISLIGLFITLLGLTERFFD